jgi:hypothetical protein
MNGSVPPVNSKQIYGAELSLHTEIVPEGIKEIQATLNEKKCFKKQNQDMLLILCCPNKAYYHFTNVYFS